MTVLPELEEQLVSAAAALARQNKPRGARVRGSLALAAGVLVALAVVLATASTGGRAPQRSAAPSTTATAALDQAARAAASAKTAPSLRRGQTWYTQSIELSSSQEFPMVPPPKAGKVAPNARIIPGDKVDNSHYSIQKWITHDGRELEVGDNGAGSAGIGIPSQAPGFGEWDPISPADAFSFATNPAAVLRLLPRLDNSYAYTGSFTALAEVASLLADEPLRPAARAAAWRAVAMLPGLRYLGRVKDPLGRPAVAVAAEESSLGPFDLPVRHQRYRFELIFDPATGAVLGSRTTAVDPLPVAHIKAGTVLFSWEYIGYQLSTQASLPAVLRVEMQRQAAMTRAIQRVLRSPACRVRTSASCRRERIRAMALARGSGRSASTAAHP